MPLDQVEKEEEEEEEEDEDEEEEEEKEGAKEEEGLVANLVLSWLNFRGSKM